MAEFYGARSEFEQLRKSLRAQNLRSQNDIRIALEVHFKTIEWSLLKGEWERLSEKGKSELVTKLLADM